MMNNDVRATRRLRRRFSAVVALGLAAAGGMVTAGVSAPAEAAPYPTAQQAYGNPFWSDEFDGGNNVRPDANAWNTEIGNRAQEGWWNNELQYYTADPSNSATNGMGQLVIQAQKAAPGQNLPCWPSGNCKYTSARLTTEGNVSLKYGRVDVRAKLPTGKGLLPAAWLLGNNGNVWPAQGELDIVEVVGNEPQTVYGTAHGPSYFNENGIQGTTNLGSSASAAYHVYSIDKKPNQVTWLVDNVPYFTLTPSSLPSATDWVFEQDMHVLLNVAVGGDWPGNPNSATPFPAKMTVDYVRLYGQGYVDGQSVHS